MIQLSSSAIRVNAPADQQLNCDAKETYCFTAKKTIRNILPTGKIFLTRMGKGKKRVPITCRDFSYLYPLCQKTFTRRCIFFLCEFYFAKGPSIPLYHNAQRCKSHQRKIPKNSFSRPLSAIVITGHQSQLNG